MANEKLIDGKVILSPREGGKHDGKFDELFMYDEKGKCIVHAEMMDYDGPLWIGFYPPGEEKRRVVMWISAKNGKLEIHAEEDR